MDIVEVNNTKENPNGVIIATYANFRENAGLNSRTYDLIIYDESQSIIGSKEGDITEIFQQHQNISIWNYLAIKSQIISVIMPTFTPALLLELDITNYHRFINSLDHIINSQKPYTHAC